MIRKTVIPTRTEAYFRKRCLGVLINLIASLILTGISFVIFSALLANTSFSETNIKFVAIFTALAAPAGGCAAGTIFHVRSLVKRGYVRTDKEASSEVLKNVLIAALVYFSIIMFL